MPLVEPWLKPIFFQLERDAFDNWLVLRVVLEEHVETCCHLVPSENKTPPKSSNLGGQSCYVPIAWGASTGTLETNRIKKRNGAICYPLGKEKKSYCDQYTTNANERQSERVHSDICTGLKDVGDKRSSADEGRLHGVLSLTLFKPRFSATDFVILRREYLSFCVPPFCHFTSVHFLRNPEISQKNGTFLRKLRRLSYIFPSTFPQHCYRSSPYAISHSLFPDSPKIY